MGLLSGLKKKAQKSAKEAYKAKVADEQKRKKKKASAASREEVKKRQSEKPKEKPKKKASYFETQAKQQRAVANVQKNKKSWAQMAQEANEKRKAENRNALGTTAKTRQIQSNNQLSNSLTKAIYETGTRVKDASALASGSIANTQKGIADYEKKTGYKFSDEQKKQITQDALKEDVKLLRDKDYNKAVKRAAQDYADKKTGKKWKVKSEDMNAEEYQKMQNAIRMGGGNADLANKAVGDKLAKKIGSRTAYAADRNGISRFSHGALQGLAPVDVEKGIGIYGEDEKQALKESKESKAGMAGYMAGFAGSMALGGTSGMGKAIAKGVGKGAAKATTKSTAKKFMQNRAGELAAETPLNVADAAKMSMDENGKVDKKQMLKYLGLNTAMTGGMGGAIEGIGIKFTKKNADEYVKLMRKEAKEGLTEAEQTRKLKLKSKLDTARQDTQAARSNSATKGYDEGQTIQQEIRTQRRLAKNKAQGKVESANKQWAQSQKVIDERRARDANTMRGYDPDEAVNFVDATKQTVPDTSTTPRRMHVNKSQAKKSKQYVTERLNGDTASPTKFDKKATKEIHDSVDRMSNMIAHGDQGGARIEARKIAEKHGKVDDTYREVNHDRREAFKEAQKAVRGTIFHMPEEAGSLTRRGSLKEFREKVGDWDRKKLWVRKSRTGNQRSVGIDDFWDENSKQFPEFFDPRITDPEERFRVIRDLSEAKPEDFDSIMHLRDEDIEEAYELMARDIYDEAASNAGKFKEVSENEAKIEELTAEREAERKAAAGEVKHKSNAIKAGRDQEHLDEIQKKIDEHDAKRDAIDDEIRELKRQEHPERYTTNEVTEEPVGFSNLDNDKDIPPSIKESRPEGSHTPPDAPSSGEPTGGMQKNVADDEMTSKVGKALQKKSLGFRRLIESSLVGFEKAAGILNRKDLLHQVNEVYAAKNRAASWIEGVRSGIDRKISGKGLNRIFKDYDLFSKANAAKRTDFCNYLTYKHAIDRLKVDKPVHMDANGKSMYTKEQYEQFIKEIEDNLSPKELKQLHGFEKDIRGYFDDLAQYRVDSGLWSKEFAQQMADRYEHYIPTYREGDDWMDNVITEGESYRTSVGKIRQATGGREPIEDLYQQMVRLTKETIRDAEENRLLNLYTDAMGIRPDNVPKGTTADDAAQVAISATKGEGDAWRVTFFSNGEPVQMYAPKNIVKGLREFNGQDFTRMMNAASKLSGPGKAFKGLITDYNLIFGIRNGARDFQQALVNSKNTREFVQSLPSAWAAIARGDKNPYFRLYQANGGKYSSLMQQGKKAVEPGSEGTARKAWNATGGKALEAIENANSCIEMTPRMAEFIGTLNKKADGQLRKQGTTLKKLKEDIRKEMFPDKAAKDLTADQIEQVEDAVANRVVDMVGKDAVDEAMRNSADITLNFSRNGVIGKMLNVGVVPYFNPSIQGLSKTIRLFSEADGAKGLLNLGMKLGTFTIAPAMLNEVMNADNKDYQMLNTRDKDSNFFIPLGDGKFIKVPKPRENAVLAEPAEYGLRYFLEKASIGEIKPPVRIPTNLNMTGDVTKDGVIEKGEYSQWKDLGQMFKSGIDNIGPVNPLSDNLFSPLLHTAQNKTWYGGTIDGTSDVLALAEGTKKHSEIRDESTSATAKWIADRKIGGTKISDIAHLSPKKIDNLMDSYLGMIYDVGISQTSDRNRAVKSLGSNPIVNQFVKDSLFSNKNGTELWAEFERLNAPKTLKGKVGQFAKERVLGHNAGALRETTQEAKDWQNLKGYDDMTYSTAMEQMLYDKTLTKKQKNELRNQVKRYQNDLRRDLVYGAKEVTPNKDPIRILAGLVGLDKAMKEYTYTYVDPDTGEKKNQHLDAYEAYKKTDEYKGDPKKNGQRFLNLYCDMRYTNGKIGESKSYPQWMTAAIICASSKGNNDTLAASYITPDASYDQYGNVKAGKSAKEKQAAIIERGKNYVKYTGTKGYYIDSQKTLSKGARDFGYEYTSKMHDYDKTMTLAESKKKYSDLAYYAADTGGYVTQRMNPGRCLVKNGHGKKEIHAFAKKYDLDVESKSGWTGDDWKAFKKKVSDAVRKEYGDQPREIQAAAYHVIVGDDFGNRPFGEIGDYSQKNDTGIAALDHQDGWGGRRGRRRHGHRRHGRGGGGGRGGSGGNDDWYKFVGDMFNEPTKKAKVKDNTNDSLLNEAYRRRIRKQQMFNQKKK